MPPTSSCSKEIFILETEVVLEEEPLILKSTIGRVLENVDPSKNGKLGKTDLKTHIHRGYPNYDTTTSGTVLTNNQRIVPKIVESVGNE